MVHAEWNVQVLILQLQYLKTRLLFSYEWCSSMQKCDVWPQSLIQQGRARYNNHHVFHGFLHFFPCTELKYPTKWKNEISGTHFIFSIALCLISVQCYGRLNRGCAQFAPLSFTFVWRNCIWCTGTLWFPRYKQWSLVVLVVIITIFFFKVMNCLQSERTSFVWDEVRDMV